MSSLLRVLFHPVPPPPFSTRTSALIPLSDSTKFHFFSTSPFSVRRRRRCGVAALGTGPHQLDFESAGEFARQLLIRAEGVLYSLADASISSSSAPALADEVSKQDSDWLSGITNSLETILKILKDGLSGLHVPYAYGFAIIILTVLVKAATFPLTKKQVESTLAMKSLLPQIKAIQQLYAGDQERIQIETARLYKLAGVNPLAGCLPTLATIPVWIGLYRALTNVANEGLLNEGFFWIPSLSGPTTIAARQSGSGTSWLFPFVDGHPPLGWSDTSAYLVLPVLLIISQYISAQIMQPSQDSDPNQKSSQVLLKLLPLMVGYFALSVPSGLSLYWFTNNILSTAQQIWLQRLGGAKNPLKQFVDETKDGTPNVLKSSSNMQLPTLVENEKPKPNIGSETDSGAPRRGERFRQIKEAEAMKRKQREEAGISAEEKIKIIEQESDTKVDGKNDNVNSGNHERNGHLSHKTNGRPSHNSTVVEHDESPEEEEMESDEMCVPPALTNSDSVDDGSNHLER